MTVEIAGITAKDALLDLYAGILRTLTTPEIFASLAITSSGISLSVSTTV
jgi:hypothetical protein